MPRTYNAVVNKLGPRSTFYPGLSLHRPWREENYKEIREAIRHENSFNRDLIPQLIKVFVMQSDLTALRLLIRAMDELYREGTSCARAVTQEALQHDNMRVLAFIAETDPRTALFAAMDMEHTDAFAVLHYMMPERFAATASEYVKHHTPHHSLSLRRFVTLVRFAKENNIDLDLPSLFDGNRSEAEIRNFCAVTGQDAEKVLHDTVNKIRNFGHACHRLAIYIYRKDLPFIFIDPPSADLLHKIEDRQNLWLRVARAYPPEDNLRNLNPGYFKPQAFDAIWLLLRREMKHFDATSAEYAFHATGLFGTAERVLEYLERWGTPGNQPLHDTIVHIKLPEKKVDLKLWADAVMQQGPEMAKLVKYADRMTPQRSADGKKFSLNATRAQAALFAFARSAENPKLAALCSGLVKEETFDEALEMLTRAPQKKNMPEIKIDGNRFDMEGATFERLPANDVHGPFLGLVVGNCQHLDNAGSGCATHGVMSENGGFYVVKKKDKIVAETWAWRGTDGEMCFDSLEALRGHVNDVQWEKIIRACGEELTKDTRHDVTALAIGLGGRTPKHLSGAFNHGKKAEPKDYNGYRDSLAQVIAWERSP